MTDASTFHRPSTALVVQDLQNDVVTEGSAFAASGAPAHAPRPFQDRFDGWIMIRGEVLRSDHDRRARRECDEAPETVYRKQIRPVMVHGADVMDRIFQAGPTRMLSYSAPVASRSAVGCKPGDLVGVAGFEPAASSSRTSGASGRLSVIAGSSVCRWQCSLAAVRGRCCTSALYFVRQTHSLQSDVFGRAGSADLARQSSVSSRETPLLPPAHRHANGT
jgi:hypothetical protein